jgi:hypothetical protein
MPEIDSIKHKAATRVHIPSREEAGCEDASPAVAGKRLADYPLNPVTHRGQDPELFWLNKYGNDDREELLRVDIRSLYRHEHISPEMLINRLYTAKESESAQQSLFDTNELFGNALDLEELEKPATYYNHHDGWSNRIIQGDSLLVMASLLEREGMAGKVQCIYFDPPYGIKYGGNWQIKLNERDVKDGSDEHLTGEPEQVKAFRDTWELHDETGGDIRQGFIYKTVPHITLKSLANNEPADEETLYDQPLEEKKKLRVAGPFTVETLQSFEPVSPESLDTVDEAVAGQFEERIFAHLKSAGVKNGDKGEQAVFVRVERLNSGYLHAEGFYNSASGEKKAYIHIGPKFGTVARQAVNEAVKECRTRGDADWLIILGFSFESNIEGASVSTSMGSFRVDKVRMHDDLMQDGLLKKDKKAASFMTIGEPDIQVHRNGDFVQLEIQGLDIYDPIKDVVNPRNIHDIAYWMVDDNYDGSNFIVRQLFFCGGDKDEFKKWQKGLSDMAKQSTKAKAEKTLRIELDDEAFDRLYGHTSHPIEVKGKGHKVAVRVISQFGEESSKVLEL